MKSQIWPTEPTKMSQKIRLNRKTFVSLMACGLLAVTLVATAQDGNTPVAAPTYKVGDSWKMQLHDLANKQEPTWDSRSVTDAGEKEVQIAGVDSANRKLVWVYDPKVAKLVSRHKFSESAPNKRGDLDANLSDSDSLVQFPLKLGSKYPVKVNWTNTQGHKGNSDMKAEVLAFEKVKVPAGEFDAFKIEVKGWWNNHTGGSGRITEMVWYAPTVKRSVKFEHKSYVGGQLWGHRVEELLEFNAAQ